ncbi:MAG: TAXI family TRAP transporter solute-binding subunit [Syntrophobacteraceae bacterium]
MAYAAAALLVCIHTALPLPSPGETARLFRIGTGGLSGVYHPIGKLIAQGITGIAVSERDTDPDRPGGNQYVGVAQTSGGSVANALALAGGEIEAGLIQADVAWWAFKGEGVFAGNDRVRNIRAVASLYPEKLQIVTRRDAGIRSVADFRGKRVSIDEIGSGSLMVMRTVLEAHDLSEKDFFPVYLKPEFTIEKIRMGELHGFVVMAGAPMEAINRVSDIGLFLVPIAPEVLRSIHARFPYLVPGEVPAGSYPGISSTPTLQVHALLAVSAAMSDDVVYRLTTALWSEGIVSAIQNGHPQGKAVSLQTALNGISIPLHPGAERFYRERGLLSKGTSSP